MTQTNIIMTCKNGRIYGMEHCEGEVIHDSEWIPECDCKGECKYVISNTKSQRISN